MKSLPAECESVNESAIELRWRGRLNRLKSARTTAEYAEAYAQLGIEVVPSLWGKIMPAKGLADATSDPHTIRRWFSAHPGAEVLIKTGRPSDVIVLIFDIEANPNCRKQWFEKFGQIPFTLIAQAGDLELVFLRRPRVQSTLLSRDCFGGIKGVSAQLDDGFVTAPGSAGVQLMFANPIRTFPKRYYPALFQTTRARALPRLLERNKQRREQITESVRTIVEDCIPSTAGTGNSRVFDLARKLRLGTEDFDLARGAFEQWFALSKSKGLIRDSFASYLKRFTRAWEHSWVRTDGGMQKDLHFARTHAFPKQAERFKNPKQQLLLALCARLENRVQAGKIDEWYLSAREAGKLLSVDKHTANRWLREFVASGLLNRVVLAGPRTAFRYRFVG